MNININAKGSSGMNQVEPSAIAERIAPSLPLELSQRYAENTRRKNERLRAVAYGRVRFIYTEYARGMGDRKIVIEMNKRGWPGPTGGLWSIREASNDPSDFSRELRNASDADRE